MNLLKSRPLTEFGIPIAGCFLFLAVQATGGFNELALTVFIIVVSFLVFVMKDHHNERYLFIVGVLVGICVEIGLRYLGYQQTWIGASFLGIPFWLPIMWGIGFVVITRFGVYMRGLRFKN